VNGAMKDRIGTIAVGALFLLVALAGAVDAQTTMPAGVIGSGGTVATGGGVVLAGTIGQSVIGIAANGATEARQGFWYIPTAAATTDVAIGGSRESGAAMSVATSADGTILTIDIATAHRADGTLTLYDALGNLVATLIDGEIAPGRTTLAIDPSRYASGWYALVLIAGGERTVLPLTVTR
jgi:hypothetical protein